MELRQLTAADLYKLSEIAELVSEDMLAIFAEEEISEKKAGMQMVIAALRYFPTEIKSFLAHVTDQTPEDLDAKGFTEPIKIIRALYQKQEFKDFLQEMKYFQEEILQARST